MNRELNDYLQQLLQQHNTIINIPQHYYNEYNVKRGLRNADGTGVLAGLTSIGEVHGYVMDEGSKAPIVGQLRYRGISVDDIVKHCLEEDRFGFEEVIFLITFGFCPKKRSLKSLQRRLLQKGHCRKTLPRT